MLKKLTFGDWISIRVYQKEVEEDDQISEINFILKLICIIKRSDEFYNYDNLKSDIDKIENEYNLEELYKFYYTFIKEMNNFYKMYDSYFVFKDKKEGDEDEKGGPDVGPIFDHERWEYHLMVLQIIKEIPRFTPEDVYNLNIFDAFNWLSLIKERDEYIKKINKQNV